MLEKLVKWHSLLHSLTKAIPRPSFSQGRIKTKVQVFRSNSGMAYCERPFANSSVDFSASGPKDMGNNSPSVMTLDLASLSNIKIGAFGSELSAYGTNCVCMRDTSYLPRKTPE